MKKILISALCVAATASMAAQSDIFENPDNEAFLGARIGVDISSTSDGGDIYSNGAGFSLGAVYNIPIYKNLYVEPGLSLFYDTFGTEVTAISPDGASFYQIDGSIRNMGFRIPLVAGYFFDFTDDIRVAPFTGPQLNFSFMAKQHWDKSDVGGESLENRSIFGEYGFKHFDLQWAFGVGVTYQQYYFSLSGAVGMTKAYKLRDLGFRRNLLNISIGYNF